MFFSNLIRPLTVVLAAAMMPSPAWAQNLAQSSLAPSDSRDTAVGAQVAEQVQQFTEGVPQLQQVDRASNLRDTSNRGSFVGADSGDATFFGGEAQSRTGTTSGSRRTQGLTARRSTRQGSFQQRTQQSRGTTLRPRLALGFHYTPQPCPRLAENIWDYLHRIPSLRDNASIRVCIEKDVVILEGTVATMHDREVSAQIVALAPGVNRIENRLQVDATDSPRFGTE